MRARDCERDKKYYTLERVAYAQVSEFLISKTGFFFFSFFEN